MNDLKTLFKWPSYSQKEERVLEGRSRGLLSGYKANSGEVIPTYISFLMGPPEGAM